MPRKRAETPPKAPKSRAIPIRLQQDQIDDLDALAARLDRNRSDLLREQVLKLLEEGENKASAEPIASRQELLELITSRARRGNVPAMKLLAEELRREEGSDGSDADADPFSEFDNVTQIRRQNGA